jgi:exopolysaccharide biosynthesis polyprenyl glycosylphosphotransferase
VVDATLRAGTEVRRLARVSARTEIGWASVAADVVAMVGGYLVADAVRAYVLSAIGMSPARFALDWPLLIFVAVGVFVFYASGLYEPEAYVSRPLHLWMLLRSSFVAFTISAVSVYVIRSAAFDESRLVLLMTFALFLLFAGVLRLGILDGQCEAWVRRCRPVSLVVGDSETAVALTEQLENLRGFDRVQSVTPATLSLDREQALGIELGGYLPTDSSAALVFIDAASMSPRATFTAASAAQALGAEVYVVSGLLEGLEGNHLLSKLFRAPVTRLRSSFGSAKPYPLKRALDIIGSATLLILCAPVIVVLGMLIRLTSSGPMFHKQTRVGRFGVPFEFLKLRSMVTDGDACIHSEYVRAFMNGTAEAVATGPGGEAIFKKVDDPRITPVGRFVRKYSFDEIPQFMNVLRGDMSLVGPRPPLPYEVSEYDDWDMLRLAVPSGITGLWQVQGRSRVSFDEMILQDLMYAQNMRLLVDLGLCLKTVPATLLGGGGG